MTNTRELMRFIRIEVPALPPRELSPNARVHWGVRAERAAECRALAKLNALDQTRFKRPALERSKLAVTVLVETSRQIVKDDDNAAACLKPLVDGCVDAGIITDDSREHLHIWKIDYRVEPSRAPLTVFEFEEVPG